MDDVIAAFELRFGDGTHLCQMREGPGKQPCGYTSVQVAAAFLDARNLPCNCPQIKSPKAGMFCVTCSSTSSMKTVSLPLLLRPQPANRWRRRLRGSPQRAPCPLSRSRLRRSQTGRLQYGRRDPALFPRLTILLGSGSCVGTRMCAPSWGDWRAVC